MLRATLLDLHPALNHVKRVRQIADYSTDDESQPCRLSITEPVTTSFTNVYCISL